MNPYNYTTQKLRHDRLVEGNWQFGCGGSHRGPGTEDCPRWQHHHHDIFCESPSILELQLAGIDPRKFRIQSRR